MPDKGQLLPDTLLGWSAARRLAAAGVVVLVLWAAVGWALAPAT